MAPEIAQNKQATKSVDVWAIGIIMHKVLTQNAHPVFKAGDKLEDFKEIMKKIKDVQPSKSLSKLAKHLFSRLCMVKPNLRFSAYKALSHPWITRQREDELPQNNLEMTVLDESH